jgi:inhibitor of cysteine peptidase
MKKSFWIIIGVVVLAVVVGFVLANQRADNSGDVAGEVVVGEAVVDEVSVALMESFPVQAQATFSGNLPDGCTVIGDIDQTLEGNTLRVRVATERPVDEMCTQALVPYEETMMLDILGLPAGEYLVDINGATANFTLEADNMVDYESDKGLAE